MKEEKMIYNTYLNSFRWYALCYAATSVYKYKHGVYSIQSYLPVSGLCNAVADCTIEQEFATYHENIEADTLGL